MVALEEFNISFIRALLRVEQGEEWAMRVFRRVAPYKPDGDLLKKHIEVRNTYYY
jgi:hypothetical protein